MIKEISHFIIIGGYIMNNEIILRIKSLFPDFTKSEKKVALYMSQHMPQITYLSIGDLANQCEVGETTILRFCKRLGFSGYYELKQQVILEIQKNEEEIHQNLPTTLNRIHTMVEETTQLLDKEKMRQTVSMIMNSQTIYMFGSGFSGLTALASQMRFASLGYKAIAARETYLKVLYANMITSSDLAIGFSISGENESTIESIMLAKKSGAKIIALTNHEESHLAKIADVVLLTAGKEIGKEGSTLVTEMSQFIVLEVLFEILREMDKENIDKMNFKVFDYINKGE